MMIRDVSLIVIISILLVAYTVGVLSSRYLGPDNLIEESCEEVIEEYTDEDIDLSVDEYDAHELVFGRQPSTRVDH